MRGNIELSGFVLTAEEWAAMDGVARAQLLRAALRRDEPWIATSRRPAPAPHRQTASDDDAYEAYELVAVGA